MAESGAPVGIGAAPGLEVDVPIAEPAGDGADDDVEVSVDPGVADTRRPDPVIDRLLIDAGLRRNGSESLSYDELTAVLRHLAARATRASLDALGRETLKAAAVQLLNRDCGIDNPEGRRILAAAFGNGRPTNDQGGVAQLHSLAELLEDPEVLKAPKVAIPRVAYRGRVSLLIGREKLSGKSTLLTAGAAAVTAGREFLGERCPTGSVLWVSADMEHANEIVQRAQRFGAAPERFHVLWSHDPLADLIAAVERVTPDAVVVDTLASFARCSVTDPGSSAEWPAVLLPLVSLARDRDIAVAISHHAKKAEGGGYRDSSAIGALVDLLLEITLDPVNPNRRNVAVIGRWPASNFAVELAGDGYQIVAGGDLSLDAQVLLYIEKNPRCSQRGVRDGIGKRADLTSAALARLLRSGAVCNVGGGNRHAYEVAAGAVPTLDEGGDVPPF